MINKDEQISHAEELALDRALKDINVPDDEPEDQPAEATDEGLADQLASIPDGLPSDLSEPSNAPAPEPEEPAYMPDPNADIQYESSAPIEDGKDKPLSEPKQKSAAPIIITMIVIVIAIISGYFFLINNHTPNPTGETPAEEEPQFQADATDIVFTKETLPRINAAPFAQSYATAIIENFTGQNIADLEIEYSDVTDAKPLIDGTADAIIMQSISEEKLKSYADTGKELQLSPVFNIGLAFYVAKDSKIDNISLENLVKIYSGEITNWKDLGGDDAQIITYQLSSKHDSKYELKNTVMKGQPISAQILLENPKSGTNALCFGFYDEPQENLKLISIDGVAPNADTIYDESYPLTTSYYLVTRKFDENENISLLRRAIYSTRGQKVLKDAGYIPAK